MAFEPIYKPFATKPKGQYFSSFTGPLQLAVIRDNFYISTWILIGAIIQGSLCFLPYKNLTLVAPAFLLLLWRIVQPIAMSFGLIHNPYMDGVIKGRTVPVFADATGNQDRQADREICAIVLATRSNSPLGILAPGFKEIGDYFRDMSRQLDAEATRYGYLGQSCWVSAADRGVSSEFMSVVYFESAEKLHEYAHGPLHTEATAWWQRTVKEHDHLAIMHEVFAAPKRSWEGIYINYHPTGLGAAFSEGTVKDERGERKVWMSPLVKGKGQLTYSKGRMGKAPSDKEWVAYQEMLDVENAA